MQFSAILLVFKFLMFSCLQVCKFTDLQVHNSIDCPYFYGLSVKISDLLHLIIQIPGISSALPGKWISKNTAIPALLWGWEGGVGGVGGGGGKATND